MEDDYGIDSERMRRIVEAIPFSETRLIRRVDAKYYSDNFDEGIYLNRARDNFQAIGDLANYIDQEL